MADIYGSNFNPPQQNANDIYQQSQGLNDPNPLHNLGFNTNLTGSQGFPDPFGPGNTVGPWSSTAASVFNVNPDQAITNLFEQAGLSLNNPFFKTFQAIAPGMQWLDLLKNGNFAGAGGTMSDYFQNFLSNATTPGAPHPGFGKVSDMIARFLGSAYTQTGTGGNFDPLAAATQGISADQLIGGVGDLMKALGFQTGMNPYVLQGIMGQLGNAQTALGGMPDIFNNLPAGVSQGQAALDWLKKNAGYAGSFLSSLGF